MDLEKIIKGERSLGFTFLMFALVAIFWTIIEVAKMTSYEKYNVNYSIKFILIYLLLMYGSLFFSAISVWRSAGKIEGFAMRKYFARVFIFIYCFVAIKNLFIIFSLPI